MRRILTVITITILVAGFSGCYYDKEEIVYAGNASTCDTTNIKYNSAVQSIIQQRCYSCHAGTASGSLGINLDSYAELKVSADNGELLRRITTTDPSELMPKGGPRLSDCEISKISNWVNNGSPQ